VTKRRAYGDGGLYWNERRQRWIATVTVGYDGRGKRMVKTGSGRTKTEAKQKLREQLRDHEDGLALGRDDYTVGHAVEDWLAYGLGRQGPATITKYRIFCGKHIIPLLGARKLRDLTAREVDAWLFELSKSLSTATLQRVRSCLNRAVKRAMARDLVKRNVVELTEVPTGRAGRRSKSLTPKQVDDVLTKTATDRLHTYIVVSLLTGGRTEELRALRWEHVHLAGGSLPPHVEVWRSVRVGGDPRGPGGRLPFPSGASWPYAGSERSRLPTGCRPANGGERPVWCSPHRSEPRCSRVTSAGTSAAPWLWYQVSTHRSGRPENYDARLSRYFPMQACRWSRSRNWSDTAAQRSPSWCTDTSCGR
jgi:hypothetical protein